MTHACSADAARRTAVVTAIIGLHFGVFLLMASGLGPPVPDPVDEYVLVVREPDLPIPRFGIEESIQWSETIGASGAGAGVAFNPAGGDYLPPYLRMKGARLAALVDSCYPAASRRAGDEGRAVVRLLVGSDGLVQSMSLVQGSGFSRLDAAVGCIVERLVIEPARRDGRAVQAEAELPIVFRLN